AVSCWTPRSPGRSCVPGSVAYARCSHCLPPLPDGCESFVLRVVASTAHYYRESTDVCDHRGDPVRLRAVIRSDRRAPGWHRHSRPGTCRTLVLRVAFRLVSQGLPTVASRPRCPLRKSVRYSRTILATRAALSRSPRRFAPCGISRPDGPVPGEPPTG